MIIFRGAVPFPLVLGVPLYMIQFRFPMPFGGLATSAEWLIHARRRGTR